MMTHISCFGEIITFILCFKGLMVPLYDLSVWSTGIVDIKTYRPWARGVHHAPPPPPPPPPPHIPTKLYFFWTLRVSRIRNEMLTVKILGLTTDLQLFSKGTLKMRIPNYCAAKIFLWHLWPCNSAPYILNDLNLVSIERWVFYLSYQHKIETKWPPGVKLQLF